MRGVDGRRRAGTQHLVVAGPLALFAQSCRGQPDERMEPVDGARDARDQLNEEIVALHVRQLVEQHIAAPLGGPLIGFGGEQDCGPANAPRHRHRGTPGLQQANGPRNTQLERQLIGQDQPALVPHRLRDAIEPEDARHADAEQHQHHNDATEPHRKHEGGPIGIEPPVHRTCVDGRRRHRGCGFASCRRRRRARRAGYLLASAGDLSGAEGDRHLQPRPDGDTPIGKQG